MVREVEKSNILLTRLDIKILEFLSFTEAKNMNKIANKVNSSTSAIKNNLRKLKHYKIIIWKENITPKPHKILLNKNFVIEIKGLLKIFKKTN